MPTTVPASRTESIDDEFEGRLALEAVLGQRS
jgi:hypothetical protein